MRRRKVHVFAAIATVLFVGVGAQAADQARIQQVQRTVERARNLRDQKKWDESIRIAEQGIAMEAASVTQKVDAHEVIVEVYRRQKKFDQALAAAARIEREIASSPEAVGRAAFMQGEVAFEMGQKAQAVAHYSRGIERSDSPNLKAACAYRVGAIESGENHINEALAAYEKVFTESTGGMDYWIDSQRGISEALRKAGRYPEALQAARIVLNATGDANGIAGQVQHIASMFKEADKNVTRANTFLGYQEFGPAGADGKPGTGDDLADPLAALGYPNYPQREQAFAKIRADQGDNAAASRVRAWTYVYSGHPSEALAHFAESFRRSNLESWQMLPTINELVAVGARGVRGHAVGLEKFYEFMRLGPGGADGKAGTADDLKDPFAEIGLAPRVAKSDGGLVPPPEAQRKALVDLRVALEKVIVADREDTWSRQNLLPTLDRVHSALVDWGEAGQAEWYQRLLYDCTGNEYEYNSAFVGAVRAARGCDLHYGGVREFWKRVEATSHWEMTKGWGQVQNYRGVVAETLKLIEKPQPLNPHLQPLK